MHGGCRPSAWRLLLESHRGALALASPAHPVTPSSGFAAACPPSLFEKCVHMVHAAIVNPGVGDTSNLYSVLIDIVLSQSITKDKKIPNKTPHKETSTQMYLNAVPSIS